MTTMQLWEGVICMAVVVVGLIILDVARRPPIEWDLIEYFRIGEDYYKLWEVRLHSRRDLPRFKVTSTTGEYDPEYGWKSASKEQIFDDEKKARKAYAEILERKGR